MRVKRRILLLLGLVIIAVLVILFSLYYTEIHPREHQLTSHLFYAFKPKWSPDSKCLAYQADGEVWVRNLINDREVLVSYKQSPSFPFWSPTGTRAVIIYSSFKDKTEIWGFNSDMTDWHLINSLDVEVLGDLIWNDEEWFEVAVDNEEEQKIEIWKFSYTGEESKKTMELPVYSSDQQLLAWDTSSICVLEGNRQIISYKDGKATLKKTLPSLPNNFVLSNDKRKLAITFYEESTNLYPVYVYFISTGELRRIESMNKNVSPFLFWSPNDEYLGFSGVIEADSITCLYVLSLSTEDVERITFAESKKPLKSIDISASWSPDGKRIAFGRRYFDFAENEKTIEFPKYPFSFSSLTELLLDASTGGSQIWIVRVPKARRYAH